MFRTVTTAGPVRERHFADPMQQVAMIDDPVAYDVDDLALLMHPALYVAKFSTSATTIQRLIRQSDVQAEGRPAAPLSRSRQDTRQRFRKAGKRLA
jgi:hypothetical protein